MSDAAESSEAAAVAPPPGGGESIAKVLQSKGPVVTCVLLRHMLKTGKDTKPHAVITKAAAESAAAGFEMDGTKIKFMDQAEV